MIENTQKRSKTDEIGWKFWNRLEKVEKRFFLKEEEIKVKISQKQLETVGNGQNVSKGNEQQKKLC